MNTITEPTWPKHKVKTVETRKRDLVIRIADWSRDKDEPAFDVELYNQGVYDWNLSPSFSITLLGKSEAKRRAITAAQTLIADYL